MTEYRRLKEAKSYNELLRYTNLMAITGLEPLIFLFTLSSPRQYSCKHLEKFRSQGFAYSQ